MQSKSKMTTGKCYMRNDNLLNKFNVNYIDLLYMRTYIYMLYIITKIFLLFFLFWIYVYCNIILFIV